MNCRLCLSELGRAYADATILGHRVQYFDCSTCGYVQTAPPTWLDKAYSSAINISDTGIMARNLSNASLVLATLTLMQKRRSLVVDCAGGHGFLVRLLRDRGVNALWMDRYCENLVARGFEYVDGNAALVTAFEVFEHFLHPTEEVQHLFGIAPNVLFSTNLIADTPPKPNDWWYYGLEHGQHIGFYRTKTLEFLANKFDKHLISDGRSTHLFVSNKHSHVIWHLLIDLFAKFPPLANLGLRSKTWSDHMDLKRSMDS